MALAQAVRPVNPSPLPSTLPTPGGGLAGGAGMLGAAPPGLAQLLTRQVAQGQPGGAGTPQQQAQAHMGGLGAPLGALQGHVGAAAGATTVPGTTNQTPFTAPSNTPNAALTALKGGNTAPVPGVPPHPAAPPIAPPVDGGGIGAGGVGQLGQMHPQMIQQLIAHLMSNGGGAPGGVSAPGFAAPRSAAGNI